LKKILNLGGVYLFEFFKRLSTELYILLEKVSDREKTVNLYVSKNSNNKGGASRKIKILNLVKGYDKTTDGTALVYLRRNFKMNEGKKWNFSAIL
jgi:hypothetical protein